MKGHRLHHVSRRFLLGALLAGGGQAALAGAPLSSLRPAPRAANVRTKTVANSEALIAAAGLSGKLGFVVADARTGRILESRNPVLGLPPASVAKALTALYALDALGPSHAFVTRLVATGPLVKGRIEGDLVLAGGGDPTLDTDGLAEMAAALKSTGVREVSGRFLVYAGALPRLGEIDDSQPDHLGYNPAISGLNLNYNRVHFEWKRASDAFTVTMDARSERFRPGVTVAKMQVVDRDVPVYTYADVNGADTWTVARAALGNGGSRWLPVRKPELYAAEVFQIFARSHGIVLGRGLIVSVAPRGRVLVERKSPPLQRILRDMLRYSTNLTAEVVGLSASLARGRQVTGLSGSAAAMNRWGRTHLGLRRPRLVDHSGLGDGARLSASDMVTALVRAGPDGTLSSILKTLPMRDGDGNSLPNSPVSIRAKTGTLNFVSALAGFVKAGNRSDLAFAIFAADIDRRRSIPDADREKPSGAKSWNTQARKLQHGLIERWVTLYGG